MTENKRGDHRQQVESLYNISQIAVKAEGLEDLWKPLFQEVLGIMDVDAGTLQILEQDKLYRKIAVGLDPEIMKEPPIVLGEGISGKVAETKEATVLTDLENVEIASSVVGKRKFHSLATVPMLARGQLVGVISVFAKKERNFSSRDLSLFSTIANQAAIAIVSIENTRLLEENLAQVKRLTALNEVAKTISHFSHFTEIHYTISGIIAGLFGAQQCFFVLHDADGLKVESPAFGMTDDALNNIELNVHDDSSPVNKVFFGGRSLVENDYSDKLDKVFKDSSMHSRSVMMSPLRFKNQSLGVVIVSSSQKAQFTKSDASFLGTLASQVAAVLSLARAYQSIEEAHKKDEAILESIAEGVYAVDRNGRYMLVNKTAQLLTGYHETELTKRKSGIIKFVSTENKQSTTFCPALEALKEKKIISKTEKIFVTTRTGQKIPVAYNAGPILDTQDRIIGGIVAFSDISKELEVDRMKKELISIATHELKAPVTAMQGYLEMLVDGEIGELNKEVKATVDELMLINVRLHDLVEDLLDVSRIEQGRMKFDLSVFDLKDTVTKVTNEYAQMAKKKNIEIHLTNSKSIKVNADPARVEEVLSNLISNAIKYTLEGSITVNVTEIDSNAEVTISDTGVGMTEDEQSHLFQKFYRVQDPKTQEVGGTGLGLYITKKMLEAMKGSISMKSTKDKGSNFSFRLPTTSK